MAYRGPIEREEHIMGALVAEGWRGGKGVVSPRPLRALANLGERLRQRYEDGCTHDWAADEDENGITPYGRQTERLEARIRSEAERAGLTLYLQTDPRGAPVYVRAAPHPIADNRYNSEAHCLYFNR